MARGLFQLRLYAGAEAVFDRRAASLPREMADAIRIASLSKVTAFRRGTDVWCYVESSVEAGDGDGVAMGLDRLAASEAWTRWLDELADVVVEAAGDAAAMAHYRQVFHSDGPPLASPFERGMFVLVVDPARMPEYEARHAEPWPEMLAALADSGFRNYSGFARGPQVAYYGHFHPDMAKALAAIGLTDTNRRWAESFQGIITSLTDDEGRLFTAREVFHVE